jgi:hypothetical protein
MINFSIARNAPLPFSQSDVGHPVTSGIILKNFYLMKLWITRFFLPEKLTNLSALTGTNFEKTLSSAHQHLRQVAAYPGNDLHTAIAAIKRQAGLILRHLRGQFPGCLDIAYIGGVGDDKRKMLFIWETAQKIALNEMHQMAKMMSVDVFVGHFKGPRRYIRGNYMFPRFTGKNRADNAAAATEI